MAITGIDYALFEQLKKERALPPSPSVLELGESNWYGDVPVDRLANDVYRYVDDPAARKRLYLELDRVTRQPGPQILFEIARVFWAVFLNPAEMVAVDMGGTERALALDLNEPIDLGRQFDVVFNLGTGEHVFNTYQFFKTIHEHTRPGGTMIHAAPFAGWYDHGFYNFQPTFWWDLAAANDYQVLGMVYGEIDPPRVIGIERREQLLEMASRNEIGPNVLLYPVLRKSAAERRFQAPMQGYYAGSISAEAQRAWTELR